MNQFPYGSEWRKWDLHMHSNASDGKMTPEEIINKALELNIQVIALTDHHTAKNIDEIRSLGKAKGISVIAGVEFRSEYGDKSVHLIGLFPEEHNGYELNSKGIYDHILSPLELTEGCITKKGRESTEKNLTVEQAFKEGLCRVQVPFKKAADQIHKFGGIVTVHAGSKSNSIDKEMKHKGDGKKNVKDLYDSLGPVKEELLKRGYIDICEIRKENDSEKFYWDKFNKVSIVASDAHCISDIGRQFTWIKADPTFNGLRQVLLEKQRVFIGDVPQVIERVNLKPTKYIKKLFINKNDGYSNNKQKWFSNVEIPLNKELVAIIGNKGSGKSALADIVGTCLNAEHSEDFQFLKKDRFLKKGYAENFKASVELYSNYKSEEKLLSIPGDRDEQIRVKYLPQHYFETICNEVGKVNEFRKEIENVVYQYISIEDKLGKPTFSELIDFKKESIDKDITTFKTQLIDLNRKLISLEDKTSKQYRTRLINEVKRITEEIEALKVNKPREISNPSENIDDPEIVKSKDALVRLESSLKVIDERIETNEILINQKKIIYEEISQLKRAVKNKYEEIEGFIEEHDINAKQLGIDINKVFQMKLDFTEINAKACDVDSKLNELKTELGTKKNDADDNKESLYRQREMLKENIEKRTNGMAQEEKEYQKYLKSLAEWEKTIKDLDGSEADDKSLKYFKRELEFVDKELPQMILDLRAKRIDISQEIFKRKIEIKKIYDEMKEEIDSELKELNKQDIKITSYFKFEEGFSSRFLSYINKGKSSSFYGTEDSCKMLRDNILADVSIEDVDNLEVFLIRIIEYLEFDKRGNEIHKENKVFVGNIVSNRNDFYSYIFALDYLTPKYEMIQNGKKLDELSPGEKGALLLVFYLALDKSEMPIIIDQPEDNLDNNSVAKILVPFIRNAKKNRQIIMVTHNPNLAVVADAEQIIHVNINKTNGNEFEYLAGSIENIEINKRIVDVLEGTMPAFLTRSHKYQIEEG